MAKPNGDSIDLRTAPYGLLLLRLVLGAALIVHCLVKVLIFTPAGTAHMFIGLGLPPWLAYFVIVLEAITGSALILGVWARLAALVAFPDLLGAILFFHIHNGFAYNAPHGGGWEYPAFWAACLLVQFLCGDGALALVRTPELPRFMRASLKSGG